MSFANVRAPSGHRLCRNLRCKEMYYETTEMIERARKNPAEAFENKIFWCLKTYQAHGPEPEGKACGAEQCPPTRACYES